MNEKTEKTFMWRSIVAIVLSITAVGAFVFNALVCMVIMRRGE